ncbi:SET_domain_containing_protein_-_putative [Leishmania major strain Friedlin]|nr:SET_domain_containing_protein_-_putative [Leishmania major strain Friedlin]
MDPSVKAAGELNTIFGRLGVPCEVCVTSAEGKHVKATANLEEGFALFEELPIVSWPSPSLLALSTPFCFQCLSLSSHQQPASETDAESPSAAGLAALPKSWSQCARCASYFCSPECEQASSRMHRLLCSCLPVVRESHGGRDGPGGAEDVKVTATQPLSSAPSSLASSPTSSEITLEALARCVAWITHRLSYAIEQQQLAHEVLQADYVFQQQQQQAGDSARGATWSTASLIYQLFTQVVTLFSRLISPPDNVEFDGVSLASWMAKLRLLLAERCATQLLVASGAPLSDARRHTLMFDEHQQQQAAPAPTLLWAEALVQVIFSTDTLRTLVGQMVLNAHAINDYVLPPGEAPSSGAFDWVLKGAGLYSLLSCFNHSCVPNAAVSTVDGTHEIVLKTTRPIRAGEPLTITYIPLAAGTASRAERQRQLRNYFFTCHCPRCDTEAAASAAMTGDGNAA